MIRHIILDMRLDIMHIFDELIVVHKIFFFITVSNFVIFIIAFYYNLQITLNISISLEYNKTIITTK
jgi:hypothetical protein